MRPIIDVATSSAAKPGTTKKPLSAQLAVCAAVSTVKG